MPSFEERIAAEQKAARERIARLKAAQAKEQREVDLAVAAELRKDNADYYEQLASRVRDAREAKRAERSARAKARAAARKAAASQAQQSEGADYPAGGGNGE
ncbi:hypothetical protein [Actinomyces sp. 565]|uniref:hypothetical protein n=1 Tax=Actinomyces sp. 565 TaxID=2057794 RepID=UPI0013A6BBEA|nr:hypothetical protein [Actinomyces sp. 565]NDR52719.1 hypothetical protein [Actinomyces sp. 565]